jgi:hypothetical protein
MISTLLALSILATTGTTSMPLPADLFPPAKEGFTITPDPVRGPSVETLLPEMERVTGVHFLVAPETRAILSKMPIGISRPLEVPAAQAWPVFESLLIVNDFCMTFVNRDEPRLILVQSLQGQARTNVRSNSIFVKPEELSSWARHPAFLITTLLDLESIDARNLSNSMRQMFTDANTQQIIPVGNSNMLMVTGFGANVAALGEMLLSCNASERKRLAAEAKQPATTEPAKKSEPK